MFTLSVVNIVPDQYKDDVNRVAEIYGCGPNNLSVKLQGIDGSIYWGCHSWWKPEDYALFSDVKMREGIVPVELLPSLDFLYERVAENVEAQENWGLALTELNLSVFDTGIP